MKQIQLTQTHIDTGIPESTFHCALSNCLKETLGAASVWTNHIAAKIDGEVFLLPAECWRFQRDYDAGKEVKPFSFTLEIPEHSKFNRYEALTI